MHSKITSFLIQTVLSAPESNRIMPKWLAGYTAGRESHPASKTVFYSFNKLIVTLYHLSVNSFPAKYNYFCQKKKPDAQPHATGFFF